MAGGINKVILVGNLGQDPDLRHTPNGNSVCELSLATNESWTKDGKTQERVEWHSIIVWGKRGEACAEHLSKGSLVCVEGRLVTRSWEAEGGGKRYKTEVVAARVEFLGKKGDSGGGGGGGSSSRSQSRRDDPGPSQDDDIPF